MVFGRRSRTPRVAVLGAVGAALLVVLAWSLASFLPGAGLDLLPHGRADQPQPPPMTSPAAGTAVAVSPEGSPPPTVVEQSARSSSVRSPSGEPTATSTPVIPVPTATPSPLPRVLPGYSSVDLHVSWEGYVGQQVMVSGVIAQALGMSGDYQILLFVADPQTGSPTTSFLIASEGDSGPRWQLGLHVTVYGEALPRVDIYGTRMPVVRADGISLR